MPDTSDMMEARRALAEKYLRGNLSKTPLPPRIDTPLPESDAGQDNHAPASETMPLQGRNKPTTQQRREQVVPVQTGGSRRPLFFLHGDWTDKAFFCYPLAQKLGPEQPFYVLEPYSFDGLPAPPSIEVMAAEHIQSMRAIQPQGPYMLGGFCNGALTAYEMARQLRAVGQEVDLLVLMDAIPARFRLICTVIGRVGALLRLGPDRQLNWFLRLEHAFRYLIERTPEDFKHIKTSDPRIAALFPPVESLRKEYPAVFYWATANYRPVFYKGKVTLFWDEQEPVRRKWWHMWAKNFDQEFEEYIIPGSHTTCKTEHLDGMAEHLSACLQKAQL